MTTLSPAAQAAQQQVLTSPYYALVYLALADIAYTDEGKSQIGNVGVDLPNNVKALPALPDASDAQSGVSGSWQVEWGPAVTPDDSNLMYVASYRDAVSGLPIFAAVCIRGTDVESSDLGIAQQIVQDLDDPLMVSWSQSFKGDCLFPANPFITEPKLSQGSCFGLQRLRSLQGSVPGQTSPCDLLFFLQGYLTTFPNTPVVVTGHSLGGCQSTVMAYYLSQVLPSGTQLIPQPFAPPTAGNAQFAQAFDAAFTYGNLWANTLDVVPNAFANLAGIKQLWGGQQPPGPSTPEALVLAIDAANLLPGSFTQPTLGAYWLQGAVVTQDTGWVQQLMDQHLPPMYHTLISALTDVTIAPFALPTVHSSNVAARRQALHARSA